MTRSHAYLDSDGPVAQLVLNRPDKLNAIDTQMLHDIEASVAQVEEDRTIRCLVVRGAGRAFSAGADLVAGRARVSDPEELSAHADLWRRVLDRLADCPVPSIAAVRGAAVAGGFELTLACDLVVLADDAHYGDGHSVWGLMPSGGASQRLPRMVGARLAAWMLFSGEPVDPELARASGLVNAVVPADQVLSTSLDMARTLAERSPASIAAMKRAIKGGLDAGPLAAGLDLEKALLTAHMDRPDVRIGIDAFIERTKPVFSRE
ncbi:enoyl-CoA hydratase/isomerase family protein [Mumia zhuanghuii]|uniref:Enoyl-CoA hydratase/isomerase family protein n=2 Tax=Mumia TaxID=1546255 RepID=A0ABW1QJT1_9ACTN|nr:MULTISPECIES: enoyl-CoA hydratase/isomerase family protein [Mumia]KAA1423044.1 enoyl-CoA hydratase/isomerase family protein [Mumia zhuanghuii]